MLKRNVQRKLVKTRATTSGWLLSGLSVVRALAVMRLRDLFSTKFLERCTDFTRTIARVQFLLNWDVIVILVVLQMVYLLRSSVYLLRWCCKWCICWWCCKWCICCGATLSPFPLSLRVGFTAQFVLSSDSLWETVFIVVLPLGNWDVRIRYCSLHTNLWPTICCYLQLKI